MPLSESIQGYTVHQCSMKILWVSSFVRWLPWWSPLAGPPPMSPGTAAIRWAARPARSPRTTRLWRGCSQWTRRSAPGRGNICTGRGHTTIILMIISRRSNKSRISTYEYYVLENNVRQFHVVQCSTWSRCRLHWVPRERDSWPIRNHTILINSSLDSRADSEVWYLYIHTHTNIKTIVCEHKSV